MHPLIELKTATPPLLITLALLCFGLSPRAQALLPPPAPDGGYPGGNTAEGTSALFNLTSGINNTAVGAGALHDNTTGGYNVGIGARALASNTTGSFNMAVGTEALRDNTASSNLAIGFRVLFKNTTGRHLTGIGAGALQNNTIASFNTAIGTSALLDNDTGEDNTAIGAAALAQNAMGEENTAIGSEALTANIDGFENTANGAFALFKNTTGDGNTANGVGALFDSTIGNRNTAIGRLALPSNTRGSDNIALGELAGLNVTTANGVICIGHPGANVNNSCYIGHIFGASSLAGTAVFINSAGKLGTTTSSRRFKEEIKPMEWVSEVLYALRPVTFRYKKEIDPAGASQFGLVAEDVEKVNPDLVVRDANGEIYTVRYEAVNAMLLNEFLKEHRKNEEQEAMIARLQEQIDALTAGLQKVSAQLEASKPAPQVVNNR